MEATSIAGLQADSDLLSRAMEAAGEVALRYYRKNAKSWHKGPGQIVTEADIEVDRCLHDLLTTARPADAWLSEESEDNGSRHRCPRVWMVDPIDGTRSFAEGLPEFTISVALVEAGQPVLASIFNPVTEEHFRAVAGQGARLNDVPMKPSDHKELANATLLASASEMRKRNWHRYMPEAGFKTIGSLAYKLALVAAGRYDGLISLRSSHDWDLAAADLILREVGATLTDAVGRPLALNGETLKHQGLVAAGGQSLYNILVRRLEVIRSSTNNT